MRTQKIPLALYIHIPFCAAKCAYCDFASFPNREKDWQRYFGALWEEIAGWEPELAGYEAATVFIGGGTPTLVDADYIVKTLDRCREAVPFSGDVEITIEGNPGTLTPEKLRAYRAAGVNRLSLGAQSFDDGLLRSLGRIHTARQIGEAVAMARAAGFSNINLDLMYALPGQGMDQWRNTLEQAVSLGVPHISAYSLIVEPGTPMAARVRRDEAVIPGDEAVNAMQRAAIGLLAAAGFGRYEISNYAMPGFECRHNLTYWLRGDYLGLGCAAHSLMRETRFANPGGLDEYLSGVRAIDRQHLDDEDIREETLMLATRTARGLDLFAWRARFGENFIDSRRGTVERLRRGDYIELADGFLRLTTRGFEVQNAVVVELLEADL